jgi:hypothetical protein
LIQEVGLVKRDALAQVLDSLEALGRGATHEPMYLIAFLEQQLGQV